MNIATAAPYFTCAVILVSLCMIAVLVVKHAPRYTSALGYGFFFVVPMLTLTGVLSPLTGFDSSTNHHALFGISFLTPFLALALLKYQDVIKHQTKNFLLVACNPIYMSSGPIPERISIHLPKTLKGLAKNFEVTHRDAIVGLFFLQVITPGFNKLLVLKNSTNFIDVVSFGFIFEFYVYFNFAGYSLIAMSLMRLIGFHAPLNFKQPFGARSVVEYWQRWHISLGNVLRTLFFQPLKQRFGPWFAVFSTFMASALWHGVTANFLLWGVFQGGMWCLSRKLYMAKAPVFTQYLLLIFAIVTGRIIFSESDIGILLSKLASITTVFDGLQPMIINQLKTLSFVEYGRIVTGAIWIILEVFKLKSNKLNHRYQLLRQPITSTLILLLLIAFSGAENNGAIYGAR